MMLFLLANGIVVRGDSFDLFTACADLAVCLAQENSLGKQVAHPTFFVGWGEKWYL